MLRFIISSLAVIALAIRSLYKQTLTPGGVAAAVITGLIHAVHPFYGILSLLVVFFISGTKFTKVKADVKRNLTVQGERDNATIEGPRTAVQVLANSLVSSLLILADLATMSKDRTCFSSRDIFIVGIISQYAAVTADTWSSELGILSKKRPILITTLKPCPPGINGGVSALGLLAALLGGLTIGMSALFTLPFCAGWDLSFKFKFIAFITAVGTSASLLDSFLGATLQRSAINQRGKVIEAPGGSRIPNIGKTFSGRDVLSNNQVNLAMAVITTGSAMIIWHICQI